MLEDTTVWKGIDERWTFAGLMLPLQTLHAKQIACQPSALSWAHYPI